MKRWMVCTVLWYALALVLLTAPVVYWGAAQWDLARSPMFQPDPDSVKLGDLFRYWGYWVWLGVMVSGQLLLLLVPMDLARERPVARRKLLVPVFTAAFFFAVLVFAGVFCLLFAQFGDHAPDLVFSWTRFGLPETVENPFDQPAAQALNVSLDEQTRLILGSLSILLTLWLVWAWVFFWFSRRDSAPQLMRRLVGWLLKGSILEFLVAVPSHIIVRGRDDCCAPAGTFAGIVCGLSIMLLSFGPGILFLYAARFRRLRPPPPPA